MRIHEIREVNVNKNHHMGKPTPNTAASLRESERKRGQRVYDAANALELVKLLDHPSPCISDGPYGPLAGFSDDAIESARNGREIPHRADEVKPAAENDQWIPYTRLESRIQG